MFSTVKVERDDFKCTRNLLLQRKKRKKASHRIQERKKKIEEFTFKAGHPLLSNQVLGIPAENSTDAENKAKDIIKQNLHSGYKDFSLYYENGRFCCGFTLD